MEPGCQLELAGAPHEDLHQVAAEMRSHLDEASPCWRLITSEGTLLR